MPKWECPKCSGGFEELHPNADDVPACPWCGTPPKAVERECTAAVGGGSA